MKKNTIRLMAGMLCAAMLFTSESMSFLTYAAPAEILSETETEPVDEQSPENPDGTETEITEEDNFNNTDVETETPKDEDSGNTETEQLKDENPAETEIEVPDEDNTDELPAESTPEISVSANSTEPFAEDIPDMTDFSIVDEGGNILTEAEIVYIEEGSSRKFHVELTPENAVVEDVTWTSSNNKIVLEKISKTEAKVALAADVSLTNSETAIVTGQIGTITRNCKVEFLPLMKDIVIVDQSGVPVPESGITILPGQQKKLGVRITPEGAIVDGQQPRWTLQSTTNLRIDANTGILTVRTTPREFPYETSITATVTNPHTRQKITATCKVTIPAPSEQDGIRCGDILFYCNGMQKYDKIDENSWKISANQRSQCTLTYIGDKEEGKEYAIFYNLSSSGINTNYPRRPGTLYRTSFTLNNERYPLQFVLGSRSEGDRGDYTLSAVYTIQPTLTNYRSTFTISPVTILSIPGGPDQEIQVRKLPDTCEMKDVKWSSGDERLVKITPTEKGATLQFGQSVGTTQITAVAKDYRGQECYATCQVKVSMTLPGPTFNSESGGPMEEEKIDNDGDPYQNTYWLIDKGGEVSITIRGLPKAQIYYTTNGKDPVINGTLYQKPITINERTTIKAYAKLEGYGDSAVSEMEFRLGTSKLSIPASVTVPQDSTKTISVTLPTGANPRDVRWESSDDDVATAATISDTQYDDDGNEKSTTYKHTIIPGSTAGKCIITAYVDDYAGRTLEATCQVTVTGKLELTPAEITLKEGDSTDIKLKTPPNVEVRWTPDSPQLITLEPNAAGAKITANQLVDTSSPQTVSVTVSMTVEVDVPQEDGTTATEERTYSARCQVTVVPQTYEVTFLGWNDTVAKIETVNRGQSANPPKKEEMDAAAPKGYEFADWEDGNTWSNIQADTIIKAKPYTVKSYTITYETGSEGSNASDNPVSYKVTDNTIVLKDAIPNGGSEKSFAGWYLNSDYSDSPITEIPKGSTGDITLYAKWSSSRKGLRIEPDPIANQTYTGKAIQPNVQVYDGDTLLTLGTDYTIKYKNNTKAADTTDLKKAPTVTVTGKGNYKGADTATFVIKPQSIAEEEASVIIPNMYLSYNNGKKLTVAPTVTWNGKKLKNNSEFIVTKIVTKENATVVTECKEAGDYTVTVSGVGNFTGERDISLTVTDKKLLSKVRFSKNKLDDIPWDTLQGQTLGEKKIEVDAGITLTDGSDLKKNTDYTVTYNTDIKEVGTYEAVFTGIGDKYAGTVTKTFKITGKQISASKLVIENLKNLTYDGTAQTFGGKDGVAALKISYKNGKTNDFMTPGEDYNLSYDNTTNAGNKATVVITGINGYTGIVKKTFKITPYSMNDNVGGKITISLENGNTSVPYEKGGAKPKVIVKYGDTALTEGKDYTVKYKNNTKVIDTTDPKKAPMATVTGKGNFTGSAEPLTFSISAQDIGKLSITAEDVMAAAPNTQKGETTGKTSAGKYKSTPKLTDVNGKALSAGTDFLKTYTYTNESGRELGPKDQVAEGSILTVTVQGTKNYTGETKVSYRVLAANMSIAKASVSIKNEVKAAIKYDLEPVTLKKEDLVVKIGKQELTPDDYTIVSYENNRKKGTAKVTIQGVGNYGGRKTVNFSINPRIFTFIKPTIKISF